MPYKTIPSRFWKGFVALAVFALFLPQSVRAEDRSAEAVITAVNSALLKSMQAGDKAGFDGRYRLLEPVLSDSFAFAFMARQSVGRHWKTMPLKDKKRLVKKYTEWSVATYAGRFNKFSDERFEITGGSTSPRGTVTVVSRLHKSDGDTVEFSYKLRRFNGFWKIVDIHIAGVSQLANTRSQFVSVLQRENLDALLAVLQKKIDALSSSAAE